MRCKYVYTLICWPSGVIIAQKKKRKKMDNTKLSGNIRLLFCVEGNGTDHSIK